jgi:hypothetical protein
MRVLLSNLAIVSIVATPGLALAAQSATGTIKEYDKASMSLTLADGTTYHLPKGFHDPGLKAGEKVAISFGMSGKNHEAKTVKILR